MPTPHTHPRPGLWRVDVVRCIETRRGIEPDEHETDDVVSTAWGRTESDADDQGELAADAWSARDAGPDEFGMPRRAERLDAAPCDHCGDWREAHELDVITEGGIDGEDVPLCAICQHELYGEREQQLIDQHDAGDRLYDEALQRAADFKGVA